MEQIFLGFITWQFLFFCLALGALVYVVRTSVEFALHNTNKNAKWWRELVLPIFPIVLGPTVTFFITVYPYPEGFDGAGGRWIFGLVAGFTSGFVVRIYKSWLSGKVTDLISRLKVTLTPNKEEPKE
jgi:hypothetical protein